MRLNLPKPKPDGFGGKFHYARESSHPRETLNTLHTLNDYGASSEPPSAHSAQTAETSQSDQSGHRVDTPQSPETSQSGQSEQSGPGLEDTVHPRAFELIEHHANRQCVPVASAVSCFNDFDLDQIESGEMGGHVVAFVINSSPNTRRTTARPV